MPTAKYLAEENAAHGSTLCFPQVSTCVAVVARLGAELVGWHVTAVTFANDGKDVGRRGGSQFIQYLNGQPPLELYIVGFTEHHDLKKTVTWITDQTGDVPAYEFDIAGHEKVNVRKDSYTLFFHDTGATPQIALKRTTKTKIGEPTGGEKAGGPFDIHNRDADVAAKNRHSIWSLRRLA